MTADDGTSLLLIMRTSACGWSQPSTVMLPLIALIDTVAPLLSVTVCASSAGGVTGVVTGGGAMRSRMRWTIRCPTKIAPSISARNIASTMAHGAPERPPVAVGGDCGGYCGGRQAGGGGGN